MLPQAERRKINRGTDSNRAVRTPKTDGGMHFFDPPGGGRIKRDSGISITASFAILRLA